MPYDIKLKTKVINPSGEEVMVIASVTEKKELEQFHAEIKTNDGDVLGHLRLRLKSADAMGRKIPTEVFVIDMRNDSNYGHVGKAMHELAFRFSLENEAEGRVSLDAVRDTHIFHYLNGFRNPYPDNHFFDFIYSLRLAKAMVDANGKRSTENLSSQSLTLSPSMIEEKKKAFGYASNPSVTDKNNMSVQRFEKIMSLAKERSPIIQALYDFCLDENGISENKKRDTCVNIINQTIADPSLGIDKVLSIIKDATDSYQPSPPASMRPR